MTTEETNPPPVVLSTAQLDAFDAFAQSLVAHPHRMTPEMWPKGWSFFEAGWSAAILAEREACAALAEACDDADSVARFIRARSNAMHTAQPAK